MNEEKGISGKQLARETFYAILAGIVGIIFVSIITHNWDFISMIKSFKVSYLVFAFSLMFLDWIIEAYVIKIIANALEYKIVFKDCLNIFLIGGFFSRITPFAGGGGEPFQIFLLSRDNAVKPGDSTAIVAIKTFIGTFTRLSVFALLPMWIALTKTQWHLSETTNNLINIGIILTLIFFLFFVFSIFKPHVVEKWIEGLSRKKFFSRIIPKVKLESSIEQMRKIVMDYETARNKMFTSRKVYILHAFILSFVAWGLVWFTPVILLRGLGVQSPWPQIVITALIFFIASAYIPTPGGSGTAEIGILALFAGLIPQPLIGVFVIVWRVFSHYLLIIFGGITTWINLSKKKKSKPR